MKNNTKIIITLVAIILLGGMFRFTAVNWDNFGAFHPDERNISWAVTRIHFFDALNPKFFAYGGLPIYLYRGAGELVAQITHDPQWLSDWGHIAVIGRYVSAIVSTLSIGLMFLVGSVYFSQNVGLLSAFLLAVSSWAIREAHFATTETMLVFFLLAMLFFAKRKKFFLLGIIWGLAVAAKTTSLLFGVIPLAAMGKNIRQGIVVAALAATVFFCFSPYTLLDLTHFRESMTYETGVALGRLQVPYTLQFLHTPPYIYQIMTMLWQAGPLVIAGCIGLILLLRKKHGIFLVFPLIYFAWTGTWYAKFARYNVPFLPFATIAAAWLCAVFIKRFRAAGLVFTALLLGSTLLWGLANWTIYLRPQTRIAASEWMSTHIPAGTHIYTEHWNDGLPIFVSGQPSVSYNRELLTVYEQPDDTTKKIYYAQKLSDGEFIILSTRRIWATMPGLKDKYPVTSVFYEKLLRGELGYTEVATFASYPSLFGITINDDTAEESVQVFDHPTVRIFQNTAHFPPEKIAQILSSKGN